MNFEELSAELQEKVRACKTAEEIVDLAKNEGYELSDEELEAISGGWYYCSDKICNICSNFETPCKILH